MGVSIRAYARHRGVSHVAVLRAIKQGRVPVEPDGTVDPAKAGASWERSTDSGRAKAKPKGAAPTAETLRPVGEAALGSVRETLKEQGLPSGGNVTFVQARTAHEIGLLVALGRGFKLAGSGVGLGLGVGRLDRRRACPAQSARLARTRGGGIVFCLAAVREEQARRHTAPPRPQYGCDELGHIYLPCALLSLVACVLDLESKIYAAISRNSGVPRLSNIALQLLVFNDFAMVKACGSTLAPAKEPLRICQEMLGCVRVASLEFGRLDRKLANVVIPGRELRLCYQQFRDPDWTWRAAAVWYDRGL